MVKLTNIYTLGRHLQSSDNSVGEKTFYQCYIDGHLSFVAFVHFPIYHIMSNSAGIVILTMALCA